MVRGACRRRRDDDWEVRFQSTSASAFHCCRAAPPARVLTFGAVQVADVDEAAGPSSDTSGMGDLSGVEVIRISSKKQRQKRRKQLHALSQQKTAPGNAPRNSKRILGRRDKLCMGYRPGKAAWTGCVTFEFGAQVVSVNDFQTISLS